MPFAEQGCNVTGIDIVDYRIKEARCFFEERGCNATFLCAEFTQVEPPVNKNNKYDIILLHDVIEHITDKKAFLTHISRFMKPDAILFQHVTSAICK